MYFKIVVESDNARAGKSQEAVCYVEADSTDDLFTMMKDYPGLKSKENCGDISMVKPVDKQEYETGKVLEWKRKYLSRLHIYF